MKHKWVLVDRGNYEVIFVAELEDWIVKKFLERLFLCVKEPESVDVHRHWIYHKNYDGSHFYTPPHESKDRNLPLPSEVSQAMSTMRQAKPPSEAKRPHLRLEAVIVCKDYGDYLAHTLPENLQHFDECIVVTHPDDWETKNVCAKNSVECIVTTDFHKFGHRFNKGRAINLGLGHCSYDGNLIHMDADIVLPHRFRNMLHRAELNDQCIYGADRVNVLGYDKWLALKANGLVPHYNQKWFVEPPKGHPQGARIMHMQLGWTPIGYFQLWHSSEKHRYAYNQGDAEHSDVLFAAQWPREKRVLLPEVIVYHLESDDKQIMGRNWKGRTSPRFGP